MGFRAFVVRGLAALLMFSLWYHFCYKFDRDSEENLHSMMNRQRLHSASLHDTPSKTPLHTASTTKGHDEPLENFVKYPCHPRTLKASKYKCVRVFNDKSTDVPTKLPCVLLRTMNGSRTPVCTYDPKIDRFISKKLREKGMWEEHLVYKFEGMLRDHPDMQFLDIGCNIGTYTITMAHLGKTVVAVDALIDNLQLLNKSLALGNLQKHVTMIWNALSDTHTTMNFVIRSGNVGATRKVRGQATRENHFQVRSIVLNDLVPLFKNKRVAIKMDVEGEEYNVLKGGEQFFDSVDVPLIQMEWVFHYKTTGRKIINFLSTRGFKAVRDIEGKLSLNGSNISKWPQDIYFVKERN